jgi:hypothetical protein
MEKYPILALALETRVRRIGGGPDLARVLVVHFVDAGNNPCYKTYGYSEKTSVYDLPNVKIVFKNTDTPYLVKAGDNGRDEIQLSKDHWKNIHTGNVSLI